MTNLEIVFSNKTTKALERMKSPGFEIVFGKIEMSKIRDLAAIGEIKYILPDIR